MKTEKVSFKITLPGIDQAEMLHIREKYGWHGFGVYIGLLTLLPSCGGRFSLPDIGYVALNLGVEKEWLCSFLHWISECSAVGKIFYFDGFFYTNILETK